MPQVLNGFLKMRNSTIFHVRKQGVHYFYYLSNITQFDPAFLASAATTPQREPQTIFILTFIYEEKSGVKLFKLDMKYIRINC